MQVEADLFQLWSGWNIETTKNMPLGELMEWHQIAVERHNAEQEAIAAQQAG